MSNPYREISPEVAIREQAENIAQALRTALALLYLAHDRGGPRMNVNCIAHGMGIVVDNKAAEHPPEWLVDAIREREVKNG